MSDSTPLTLCESAAFSHHSCPGLEGSESADELLMADVRSTGCPESQAALYRRHWFRLVTTSRRYTGESHAAEDVASEALVRTLRRLSAGAEISSFPRYAQMVARNVHVDAHRGRPTLVLVDEFHDEGPERMSPRDEIAEIDLTMEIAGLLAQLGPRHRQILQLTVMDDVPTHVAAAIMGIKPNAAASLALRARAALRAAYLRHADTEGTLPASTGPVPMPGAVEQGMAHASETPAPTVWAMPGHRSPTGSPVGSLTLR